MSVPGYVNLCVEERGEGGGCEKYIIICASGRTKVEVRTHFVVEEGEKESQLFFFRRCDRVVTVSFG